MLMNQILDSSHSLRDPGERSRSLKRSASVASLPTPPRTQHKRSRSRPRTSISHYGSDDSGSASELDDEPGGGYAERVKRAKTTRSSKNVSDNDEDFDLSENESPERKKRRTLRILPGHDEEEDENAFWTGRSDPSHGEQQEKKVAQAEEIEETSPSPALLRYRVKAPVSPPPSRRLPSIQAARAASAERDGSSATSVVPVTPPRNLSLRCTPPAADAFKTPTKPAATKIWPKRDSPNNPFLVESSDKVQSHSEWDSSDDDEEVVGEARVREGTPTPTYEEKPTITYVFRGQKATFHNPLYGLAPEVVAASKLPIDHPDYEATEACPPKRLIFSTGKRKSRDRSRESTSTESVKRAKVQCEDDQDESSEGERRKEAPKKLPNAKAETAPVVDSEGLPRAREGRERKETAAKDRLAPRDGLRAGAIFAERDEPARRAMGPLRSA